MQAFYQAELQPAIQFGEGRSVRASPVIASPGCIFSSAPVTDGGEQASRDFLRVRLRDNVNNFLANTCKSCLHATRFFPSSAPSPDVSKSESRSGWRQRLLRQGVAAPAAV